MRCTGKKAPSTGLIVYQECELDIGDLALNIDLKFILADFISYTGSLMPELFKMLGYPPQTDINAVLELVLWAWFPDAGFAQNYGMTADMFFRKVTVKDCNLNLSIRTDEFINSRSEEIETLGDSVKGTFFGLCVLFEFEKIIFFFFLNQFLRVSFS